MFILQVKNGINIHLLCWVCQIITFNFLINFGRRYVTLMFPTVLNEETRLREITNLSFIPKASE